jgi:hypothetical protein
VAELLADAGVPVVQVTRSGAGVNHSAVTRIAVDVAQPEALLSAVPKAAVVYNCVNPAYHRWTTDWPPIAAGFLEYAEQTGAILATCSNLYGYGPVNVPMTESLPLAAQGTKARVRVQMWNDALAAHEAQRIRMTEVRGSDYICAGPQSMFGDRVMPRILAGKKVQLLGDVDQPHTWTAPLDVARLLAVVGSDERAWGRAWHVPSNPAVTQRDVVNDLADAAGVHRVGVSTVPGAMVWALGWFNRQIRELAETDYQRERAYVLDDTSARTVFGIEPTPWEQLLLSQVEAYR